MNPGQLVALAVIGIAAYMLLTGVNPFSELISSAEAAIDPRVAEAAARAQENSAAAQQAAQTTGSARGGIGVVTGAAGTAGGIAATAGVAASTALLATGIAAAGGLLIWGISQRGWFRGGEEGIKVNPARDEFIQVWANTFFPGTGTARQFDAMRLAFHFAGVRGDVAEQTIAQLYAADTMDEFDAAAKQFLAVIQNSPHRREPTQAEIDDQFRSILR